MAPRASGFPRMRWTGPSRRTRHDGLAEAQHLHAHDDDIDELEAGLISLETTVNTRMDKTDAKLDRFLWAAVLTMLTSAFAIVVWATQIVATR